MDTYTARVGERGQVTIPKPLRDRYGFTKGVEVEFVASDRGLSLRKGAERESAFRRYLGVVKGVEGTDRYIEEMRGR